MAWTQSEIDELARLVEAGLSARAIGDKLKKSRSAIIGACFRRGLKLKGAPPRPPKPKKPWATRRTPFHPRVAIPPENRRNPQLEPIEPLHIAFAELEPQHCRYPYGDSAPYTYCGHPQAGDSSYCAYHDALCHGYTPEAKPRGYRLARVA